MKIAGFDLIDPERELTNIEYSNLVKKSSNGYIPANFFRSHLFNSTSRQSKELKRKKMIYDDGKVTIKVNRSLHQRHRDLLSLLFTENRGTSKPDKNGRYFIYINLFDVAKKMGYKNPQGSRINIKEFLDNLRATDIEINEGEIVGNCSLLGMSRFDKNTGFYVVEVPAITSQYHILSYGVLIEPIINREIIKIPNSISKLKALVSYLVSNKPLSNGIKFQNICTKLEIVRANKKSEFKRELLDNAELLAKFNIIFNAEKDIISYSGTDKIKFERAIKPKEIQKSLFDMLELEDSYNEDLSKYQGKKGIGDDGSLFEIREVIYDKDKDSYRMYFVGYRDFAHLEKEDLKMVDKFIINYKE